jgi:hypothetical protein
MVRSYKKRSKQRDSGQFKAHSRAEFHEIKWLDTYEESAGWHSIEHALKMRPKAVLSVGYLVWEQKEFTILAADIDPSLVGLLKQADTLEELLVLIKKANLDGSDCGRVQVIPGQWIVDKKIIL